MQESNKVESAVQVKNEVKQDEFRVDDDVWCILRGKGKVVMVLTAIEQQHCPIVVDFEKTINPDNGQVYSKRHQYTKDGRWYQDFNRTLFFSEPKIEASVTRPFVPTLAGKRVVVVHTSAVRLLTIFKEDKERIYVTEEGHYWDKDKIAGIYEVSSENLLKP